MTTGKMIITNLLRWYLWPSTMSCSSSYFTSPLVQSFTKIGRILGKPHSGPGKTNFISSDFWNIPCYITVGGWWGGKISHELGEEPSLCFQSSKI